jgi:hypothetical protein
MEGTGDKTSDPVESRVRRLMSTDTALNLSSHSEFFHLLFAMIVENKAKVWHES